MKFKDIATGTTHEIEIINRDGNYDWTADFYNVGGLEFDEESHCYCGVNIDYMIDQAIDMKYNVGDFMDGGTDPDSMEIWVDGEEVDVPKKWYVSYGSREVDTQEEAQELAKDPGSFQDAEISRLSVHISEKSALDSLSDHTTTITRYPNYYLVETYFVEEYEDGYCGGITAVAPIG